MFISIIEINHLTSYQLCMIWLNWPLKFHSSLWTSTFDTHTQHTRLCLDNAYLICVIVHVQMWCICSNTCWSNQKDFWVFYMFLKVILYFHVFSFCSKCIFVFFFKNWFRGSFARSSWLKASCEMCLRKIKKSHFHIETLTTASRVLRD